MILFNVNRNLKYGKTKIRLPLGSKIVEIKRNLQLNIDDKLNNFVFVCLGHKDAAETERIIYCVKEGAEIPKNTRFINSERADFGIFRFVYIFEEIKSKDKEEAKEEVQNVQNDWEKLADEFKEEYEKDRGQPPLTKRGSVRSDFEKWFFERE